ncbi:pyridoxamine 5'-phosphate oxidase family protein [Methanobrevibacter sp. TMH8]|uniref:pyridoxamine 5'-phosphate oxidase family protein n=1 Tax=Methanobrevibacter sp. TMH8 TaxID=2848611 RepID=UPI001CC9B7E1|nr:pyridoxamine 5'-phosphate oxidase family protein [Methanobrevibacter sp. TMH8]MBZ9571345.1 pyridoxamine 5'-phosphate oxidase family protein [Methanobrevibacter sp. TMH8]
MNYKECIDFANENPVAWLATSDKDQPHVRAMGMWFAAETGFYFQASTVKELVNQIKENPKIEIAFFRPDEGTGKMLRVEGKAEIIKDIGMKKKCLEDRPFLKDLGLTAESDELFLFRIHHGKAHFWTMETNLLPKEIIEF